MKLYYFPVAPNPTRVLVYVQEKGIDIERQQVSLRDGEQNSPEHLARNPRGAVPVLELDDGRFITESLPIMEYLEECYPEPPMIGTSASERAFTRERERLAEMRVLNPTARLVHATNSPIGLPPDPAVAKVERERVQVGWRIFDEFLARQDFVMAEGVSMADCTLFAGLYMGEFFGVNPDGEYRELLRWYEAFKARPAAQIL